MANHKKEEFNISDQQISLVAKAMSHPARIAILRILAENKRYSCGEIVARLPLAQATVSHHLKELQEASLILMVNAGKSTLYEINWVTWNTYVGQFNNLLSLLNNNH
ncbi:helix-turn-helix transcriptional regulator [Mucilaginibacter sp. UR6-11]|uniref:ArsR/SmtB family transcription factor n=1 Tax=Mucilaginibacter sp. UR6-11 TaxID=1435644 RepID=UPI001E43A1DD|nr:winged helix-turn-helix domain-containing protein [Mucilaginibacter sp. UR6-11]MCC8424593.1 helix-turn-helix domain-containing protein [Mucilaginibacter sp. UR6-11]